MPQSISPFGGAPPTVSGVGARTGAAGSKRLTTFAEMSILTANAEDKECDYVILFFFLILSPPFFLSGLPTYLFVSCLLLLLNLSRYLKRVCVYVYIPSRAHL
jgi:hypothetical protein